MSTCVIILAAGHGTRMGSDIPKVLHQVGGISMIKRLVNTVLGLGKMVVVVSPTNHALIAQELVGHDITFVIQEQQLGTAHAVSVAKPHLLERNLILNGDAPLVTRKLLEHVLGRTKCELLITTALLPNPANNGRVIAYREYAIEIIEAKDCTAEQLKIQLVNCGIYLASKNLLLSLLDHVKADNAQQEYYLTDLVRLNGFAHTHCVTDNLDQLININSKEDLDKANEMIRS